MKIFGLAWLLLFLLGNKPTHYLVAIPDSQLLPQYGQVNGRVDGHLPALLRRFAADTGIDMEIQPYPIRRYMSEFEAGRVDFILPSNPLWMEREIRSKVTYSKTIMQSRSGYIGLSKDLDPAKIKQIATLSGYTITPFKSAFVNYVNSVDSALLVLNAGRVDLVYLHFDAARAWLRQHPEITKPMYFHETGSERFDYHLATIKYPEIIDRFNRWMQQNRT